MTRLIAQLDHAIPAAGLMMASLQGTLVRASYVGITGMLIELCGRIVLTAIHAALAEIKPRHHL